MGCFQRPLLWGVLAVGNGGIQDPCQVMTWVLHKSVSHDEAVMCIHVEQEVLFAGCLEYKARPEVLQSHKS